ncbi:unnamed protein product, partial [Prorocentrum cordatum]
DALLQGALLEALWDFGGGAAALPRRVLRASEDPRLFYAYARGLWARGDVAAARALLLKLCAAGAPGAAAPGADVRVALGWWHLELQSDPEGPMPPRAFRVLHALAMGSFGAAVLDDAPLGGDVGMKGLQAARRLPELLPRCSKTDASGCHLLLSSHHAVLVATCALSARSSPRRALELLLAEAPAVAAGGAGVPPGQPARGEEERCWSAAAGMVIELLGRSPTASPGLVREAVWAALARRPRSPWLLRALAASHLRHGSVAGLRRAMDRALGIHRPPALLPPEGSAAEALQVALLAEMACGPGHRSAERLTRRARRGARQQRAGGGARRAARAVVGASLGALIRNWGPVGPLVRHGDGALRAQGGAQGSPSLLLRQVIALPPAAREEPLGGPPAPGPAPKVEAPGGRPASEGGRAPSSSRRSRSVDELGLGAGSVGARGSLWDGAAGHQTWHQRPSSKAMVQEPEGRPRERARNVMLGCRFDDDAAGHSSFARQGRADSARLATARKRIDIIREPDPAGAPLSIAGPGREANFLIEADTGKKYGRAKFFDSAHTKRCTTEIEYRGKMKMAPLERSKIWDVVFRREGRDDGVGYRKAQVDGAAGLQGGDRINFKEIQMGRKAKPDHLLSNQPVANLLHHHAGPEDGRQSLQRSASAPPEPGERTPVFVPYTRLVGSKSWWPCICVLGIPSSHDDGLFVRPLQIWERFLITLPFLPSPVREAEFASCECSCLSRPHFPCELLGAGVAFVSGLLLCWSWHGSSTIPAEAPRGSDRGPAACIRCASCGRASAGTGRGGSLHKEGVPRGSRGAACLRLSRACGRLRRGAPCAPL